MTTAREKKLKDAILYAIEELDPVNIDRHTAFKRESDETIAESLRNTLRELDYLEDD